MLVSMDDRLYQIPLSKRHSLGQSVMPMRAGMSAAESAAVLAQLLSIKDTHMRKGSEESWTVVSSWMESAVMANKLLYPDLSPGR